MVTFFTESFSHYFPLGKLLANQSINFLKGYNYGISVSNLGKTSKMINENVELPVEFKFGLGKKFELSKLGHIKLAFDLNKPSNNDFGFAFGADWSYNRLFSLLLGYKSNNQLSKIRTGVNVNFETGLILHKFSIGYGISEDDIFDNLLSLDYTLSF